MSKPADRFHLRTRTYPEGTFVSLWLCRGPLQGVTSGLMWGEVLPMVAHEIAKATGLEIVQDSSPLEGLRQLHPRECATLAEQLSLFPE